MKRGSFSNPTKTQKKSLAWSPREYWFYRPHILAEI
jgi:hypothetical protein